jgi:hypothetical protein
MKGAEYETTHIFDGWRILYVWCCFSARSGFYKGLAAYQTGDFATALKEWRPGLAEQGSGLCCCEVVSFGCSRIFKLILVLCMIMAMALFRIMLKL